MASWISQLIKSPPAIQETLGWEDPLEKGKATHSSILAWRIPWPEESGVTTVPGVTRSRTRLSDFQFHNFPAGPLGAFNPEFDKPLVSGPSPHLEPHESNLTGISGPTKSLQ